MKLHLPDDMTEHESFNLSVQLAHIGFEIDPRRDPDGTHKIRRISLWVRTTCADPGCTETASVTHEKRSYCARHYRLLGND